MRQHYLPDVEHRSTYEVEVIPGLEQAAERELRDKLRGIELLGHPREGRLSIRFSGELSRLNTLRSVVAVYAVLRFDVPRPKALLGHAHLQRLLAFIRQVIAMYAPGTFRGFHLSAAGADSPTFNRLKESLSRELAIPSTSAPGELSLVARRPPDGGPGWDVLVRTSPRPLAARAWRVCDLPGALNASAAHVMDDLSNPARGQRFLNLACGSGTLLIERLLISPVREAIGVDHSESALACARENLIASGYARHVRLILGDATRLPFPDASFDALVADLPFGMLVGDRAANERLYPGILHEAARVATADARFVVITASRKLFESTLVTARDTWRCARVLPLKIPFHAGYIRPAIYVLRRTGTLPAQDRGRASYSARAED